MRFGKIHPRYAALGPGALLPRLKAKRRLRVRGVEDSLQLMCEAWLDQLGLVYFHIPNSMWRVCAQHGGPAVMAECSDYLGGMADLLVLHKGLYLSIELKSPGRKPRKNQRDFADAVGGVWCDNIAEFKKIVADWLQTMGEKIET